MNQTCTVIAICNAKGGTAKSTSSINLGAGLGKLGFRVALIDNDPQKANMTMALGQTGSNLRYTMATLLSTALDCPEELPDYIAKTILHVENMDLLPANKKLTGICTRLSVEQTAPSFDLDGIRPEFALRTIIDTIRDQYDYIIIDCGPKLDMLMTNAMVGADQVIIPVQAHYLAMEGLTDILETVKVIQQRYNPNLTIGGILLTMYQSQTNLCRTVSAQIADQYGREIRLFASPIVASIKVAENPVFGGSLFQLFPNHPATKGYADMAQEVAYG
ncbi:ParA family protein [Bengtsoniella intestinalis]|uniref:ParA family protein n=1 Tax=Bengtsoniella intestinalis TaxID=3073143 RepID=UPI00391F8AF3